MGVLPLEFIDNQNKQSLNITGEEKISIIGIKNLKPGVILECKITLKETNSIHLKCRIDTNKELAYYKAGGILNYVLNDIISKAA